MLTSNFQTCGDFLVEYDEQRLVIKVLPLFQEILRQSRTENPDQFGSDQSMHEVFEHLVDNSELEWINPWETGDLTSAPILGILGPEQTSEEGPYGVRHVGCWPDDDSEELKNRYQPILARWGFMDYQLRSPQDDLADKGEVTFISGN